ncbi:MAG: efflux RND transporter periplasmic adaptor subunit [Pirellula sp.]
MRLAMLLTLSLASSLSLAHEGHQPLPTKGVQVDTERGYINLSGQARDAIGLETAEVTVGEVSSRLFAYAETIAPWNAKAFGSAQISGRITRLLVRPGDTVAKGQVVAELSSRELDLLQLEFSQAEMELALNKQLLEMTKPSANSGAVPMQRLFDLENAYQQSENSLAIARIRAKTLGVDANAFEQSDQQPIRHLVRSPIAGRVVHSDLSEGKFVDAFEHLFEIVNSDVTWVRLQLLEKDLFNVSIGQTVFLEFAEGTVSIEGTIDRVSAGLEPKTQVVWAWVTVSNPAVIPGLVGSAVIHTTSDKDRMAIPLSSVYSDGLQTYVFVEEASTRSSAEYRKRNVKVGYRKLSQKNPANSGIEIIHGDVYPGDRVVVKGGHELSSLFFLGVLKLSPEDRIRLGIKTATATHRQIANAIPLAASVTLPPENRSVASSQLAGTIHSHTLSPGREVRAGEILMEIASPEFYTLQLDLLKSTLDADLARQRARRLQDAGGDAISRRVLLETTAKADQLEGRAESLKRQLASLGLNSSEIESISRQKQIIDFLPIRAAIDGQLISWVGTLGETVVANQSLVEIHNLNSIWIEAHLPTQLRNNISVESQGQASVLSSDNIHFPVHVNRIGPIVSETTRTQRIWLVPNLDPNPMLKQGLTDRASLMQQIGMLRDGMQLTVLIKSVDGPSALVVPSEAVLRDGLHAFVFVQKADDYIERRRVTVGRADGEFIEITSGIVAGEAVVSAGGRELQTAFASLR